MLRYKEKCFTNFIGRFIVLRKVLYYILNFTWGIFMTLLGYILLFILWPFGKIKCYDKYTLYLEFRWKTGWGFSIGTVFFTTKNPSQSLLYHEFGHTVQNAIFGPLTPFLVSIPSITRYYYRFFRIKNKKKLVNLYDDIWFEGTATHLGLFHRWNHASDDIYNSGA